MKELELIFVKTLYKSYQENFDIKLPDFDDIIFDDHMGDVFVLLIRESGKYVLKINSLLSSCDIHYYIATLYHEFTHCMDLILNPYEKDSYCYTGYFKGYSEIHASMIELKILLELSDNELINDLNKKVFWGNQKISCEDYLMKKISLINFPHNSVLSYKTEKEYLHFHDDLRNVLYCIGYILLLNDLNFEKYKNEILSRVKDSELNNLFTIWIQLCRENRIDDFTRFFSYFYFLHRTLIVNNIIENIKIPNNVLSQ